MMVLLLTGCMTDRFCQTPQLSMGNHGTFLSLGDSGSWLPPFIPLANDVSAQCCRSSCDHRWRKSAAMLKSRQGCGCFGSKELLENIVGPF